MCPLVSRESEAVATAQGILIAKRKFDERQAFDELMDIARRRHVSVVAAARQLIKATQGTTARAD